MGIQVQRLFVTGAIALSTAWAASATAQDTASRTPAANPNSVVPQQAPPMAIEPLKPGDKDALVARYVSRLLPKKHISGRQVDDQVSSRALDTFVKMLDPMKLYFLKSDINEFERYRSRIDELILEGDLSPAYNIFTRYLQRVNERVQVAQTLLTQEMDFTVDESIVIDPKAADYAATAEQSYDRWRKQIKLNILDLKDEGKTVEEAREQLSRRYTRYARRWAQTDADELLELYLTSVTMAYDPHTTYMSPGSLEDFQIMMRLNLEGIGAALREKDGYTVVSNVIAGGAADKDGRLKEDDYIVSVGQGTTGEMVDIVELPLKQVVDQIRGRAGTTVRLGVKKGGAGEVEVYQIVRAQVELEESAARGKVIEHETPDGTGKLKLGYINLPSFYLDMDGARNNTADFRSSTRDVRKLLEGFRNEGVDGVVLDLSKNGGGSLTEAISLTGLFIDRGPVVQVKNSNGSVQDYADEESGVAWNGPLVVLTSKFSASASEILAGAIKDYQRGIVIGDPTTHGKGTVQTLMDLGREVFHNDRTNLGALKVTLQQFYLPDGDSTQRAGVSSDVILPSITSVLEGIGEADLDYALEHDRVKAAKHRVYNMVPGNLVTTLRQNSIERVGKEPEFMELMRRRDLYVRTKEEKSLSLKEDEFMARRKELDAQKEAEKEELELEKSAEIVFRDYFYNREALNIAHDYVVGLREQNLASAR
ncbi:MAG: carboxy terminal-processing peptidase [Planctomycetaceae bacterium]